MDRILFNNIIDPTCANNLLLANFTAMMSLYDIILPHERDIIKIEAITSSSLNLTLPSEDLAREVKGRFDRIEINKYNTRHKVYSVLNGSIISIQLIEVSG